MWLVYCVYSVFSTALLLLSYKCHLVALCLQWKQKQFMFQVVYRNCRMAELQLLEQASLLIVLIISFHIIWVLFMQGEISFFLHTGRVVMCALVLRRLKMQPESFQGAVWGHTDWGSAYACAASWGFQLNRKMFFFWSVLIPYHVGIRSEGSVWGCMKDNGEDQVPELCHLSMYVTTSITDQPF